VITRDNLREINRLLDNNSDFSVILSNLLFSANNPFQSNFAFISDMSYTEKVAAKIQNDYEPTGSLSYIFNRKYFQWNSIAGPTFAEALNEFKDSKDELGDSGAQINSMDINTQSMSSDYRNQTKSVSVHDEGKRDEAFLIKGNNMFLDTSRIIQQQERKVARVDLLIASLLDLQIGEDIDGSVSAGTKSVTTIRRQPNLRTDGNDEYYLDLFGKEENRVEIFGRYIGATQVLLQNDFKKKEEESSLENSL